MAKPHSPRQWTAIVREQRRRFQAATGLVPVSPTIGALPRSFLQRPVASPEKLLRSLPLNLRTQKLLRGHPRAWPQEAAWTYERLLTIPGFGWSALLDVVEAAQRETPRSATLTEELAGLLGKRRVPASVPETPLLDRALALAARALPATEDEIAERLIDGGLTDRRLSLAELEYAARFSRRGSPFVVFRREGIVMAVNPASLELANRIYVVATRAVTRFGLCTVDYVSFASATEDRQFVERIVVHRKGFDWLDRPRGWFWFVLPRARLVRTLGRVLAAVASPVPLVDLAETLFRNWPLALIPPLDVLHSLCASLPHLRVQGDLVSLAHSAKGVTVTDKENRVLEIFRKCGPLITASHLPTLARQFEIALNSLCRLLRSSRLVLEHPPGVFRLVGGES